MYLIRVLNGSGLIYHARMNLQRPKLLPLWQALTLGAALLTLTPGANAQTVPEKPPAIANSDLNAKIMFFVLMGEYAAVKGDYTGAADYFFQVAREFKHEELFEKGVQYQFIHTLALLGAGLLQMLYRDGAPSRGMLAAHDFTLLGAALAGALAAPLF